MPTLASAYLSRVITPARKAPCNKSLYRAACRTNAWSEKGRKKPNSALRRSAFFGSRSKEWRHVSANPRASGGRQLAVSIGFRPGTRKGRQPQVKWHARTHTHHRDSQRVSRRVVWKPAYVHVSAFQIIAKGNLNTGRISSTWNGTSAAKLANGTKTRGMPSAPMSLAFSATPHWTTPANVKSCVRNKNKRRDG